MARYAQGEVKAFDAVYDALAPLLRRHLARRTADAAEAEDLLQQTFLQMIRARESFIQGADVTPWAFAIARALLIDHYRRRGRRACVVVEAEPLEDAAAPAASPEAIAEWRQAARHLASSMSRLTEAQREAFELVKLDGLSQREAAEVLGTTEKAIKALVHRASEVLRACFAGNEDRSKAE